MSVGVRVIVVDSAVPGGGGSDDGHGGGRGDGHGCHSARHCRGHGRGWGRGGEDYRRRGGGLALVQGLRVLIKRGLKGPVV